jgi:hypothetical protein
MKPQTALFITNPQAQSLIPGKLASQVGFGNAGPIVSEMVPHPHATGGKSVGIILCEMLNGHVTGIMGILIDVLAVFGKGFRRIGCKKGGFPKHTGVLKPILITVAFVMIIAVRIVLEKAVKIPVVFIFIEKSIIDFIPLGYF